MQEPFQVGDRVIYPSRGIGQIEGECNTEIAGVIISSYEIVFLNDKVRVKVPKDKIETVGLRHISTKQELETAISVLKSPKTPRRGMWGRIAREYGAKIASGNLSEIAGVLRDLYNSNMADVSSGAKKLYESALLLFSTEFSMVFDCDLEEAKRYVIGILHYREH
ncbi:CarD family transcriptional regulator [Candidatus Fokinia crypta]|uniref:CarD family transcriptional regulator n=1 Tax=Candidatus Fokinia crypta TaxID=1920990 RepID=A0ABZ0UU72_9RICK|nr:CarD family transcriptional regulator [Candidatus Fokinia cryptica]WPX97610.1 Putative CarD family transcriptional regulator [Candidatus Fokinia cryptica]